MAQIAIIAAIEVGTMIYRLLNRPKTHTAAPVIDMVSTSANGSPIPIGYGTVRVGAQIIWSSGIDFKKRNQSSKGGPTQTYYNYFVSFAAAIGEGPMCFKRIWGDSKLIYVDPGLSKSEYPAEDFPAWDTTVLYNPGNIVSYLGQVYEALIVSTGVTPGTSGTTWQLISDYPPWDPGVNYSTGDVVTYPTGGPLYVAQAPSLAIKPTSGATTTVNGKTVNYWIPLNKAYPAPTFYPGDELQLPDPTIQSFETADFTPAYRGLGYFVYDKFPLLNFGNRLPNIRAEVSFMKARNVL